MMTLQLFRSLHPEVGGPLAYFLALADALRDTAVIIAVASLEPVPATTGIDPAHAGTHRLGLGNAFQLWRWLRRNAGHYGVIHIHGVFGWHAMFAATICRHSRIPYVISTHGHLLSNALAQKPHKKRLYLGLVGERFLRQAAAVIATSPLEQRAILAVSAAANVVIVPPGIRADESGSARVPVTGTLRLLYLGRLHPHKQIPLLFRSLAALPAVLEWRLTLAGTGERAYIEELSRLVADLQLQSRVTFAGYLRAPEKRAVLAQTHVLALPSLSENFSFAVAEALAHGIPAVVTEEIGLADTVAKYGCGVVVPVGDSYALMKAIVALSDPSRLRAASEAARHCAANELTMDAMSRALLRLYQGAVYGAGNDS